jgi:hypothetical protein
MIENDYKPRIGDAEDWIVIQMDWLYHTKSNFPRTNKLSELDT